MSVTMPEAAGSSESLTIANVGRVGVYLNPSAMGLSTWAQAAAVWQGWTGVSPGVTRAYYAPSSFGVPLRADIQAMIAAGTKICIDLKPAVSGSPADLASMTAFLQALQQAGAACEISLWHEPQFSGLTSAQFLSLIAYYGPTVRQFYPLVICLSGTTDTNPANGYYPPDSAYDKIVVDAYAGSATTQITNAQAQADAVGKPFGIWEFNGATDTVNGQSQSAVTAFFQYIQNLMLTRLLAGKPCADVILFSSGNNNWLGYGGTQAAGFEGGTANWTPAGNATITGSTSQAHSGSGSLQITAVAAGNALASHCPTSLGGLTANAMPVTAGQTVYAFGWFRALTTVRNCQVPIVITDNTGAVLSTTFGSAVADTTTGWTQVINSVASAPSGAAWAVVETEIGSAAAGESHLVDDVDLAIIPATNDLTDTIEFPWDYRLALWETMWSTLAGPFPALSDTAGAADALTGPGTGNTAGAADSLSVSVQAPVPDAGGAVDSVVVADAETIPLPPIVTVPALNPLEDESGSSVLDQAGHIIYDEATRAFPVEAAGASEYLSVVKLPVPAPVPNPVPLKLASPAFIRSQMPRMHAQNLLTGQWYHRDIQGVTSPSITWNLNQPDTFTCTLAPPRPDMMDSTGNPLLAEWRDAIYLEESDTIRWGGILTSSTFNGPAWQITATGFAGYPAGIPYEGPVYTEYNIDALDVVRYIWGWVQGQPNGNIRLQLEAARSGVLLGANVTNLMSGFIARNTYPKQTAQATAFRGLFTAAGTPEPPTPSGPYFQRVWLSNAASFTAGMDIMIGTEIVRIVQVIVNTATQIATGAILITPSLNGRYGVGTEVLQVQTHTTLARDAAAGQNQIWTYDSQGFTSGETILIGSKPYIIGNVATNTVTGIATGLIFLQNNLSESHRAGEQVVQAPTPFQLLWWNSTDCGQEISSIQAEAVFDWREIHNWTSPAKEDVVHLLHFGVPRIGVRQSGLRFAEGENIIQAVQVTRDGTRYADSVIGLGAGQGSSQIRAEVSQLAGRLRRVQVYTDQTVQTTARMSSKARRVLQAALALDTPVQVVIKNHPNAPFGSFFVGDDIPVTLATGWRNTTTWCRITSMQQDPTTDLMTLTTQRSDSLTYMAQSGTAGTL